MENNIIHPSIVSQVSKRLALIDTLYDLSEIYKIFGDVTRLRILDVLLNAEMCVNDIAYVLNMSQSAISHQLKTLRQSKIVKTTKKGKIVYYRLANDYIKTILKSGIEYLNNI